jgi:hypothetical protein
MNTGGVEFIGLIIQLPNYHEVGKPPSSRKLLLAPCVLATPEDTIHMDGALMARRWWRDGRG